MKRIIVLMVLSVLMTNMIEVNAINREVNDITMEQLDLSGNIIIEQLGKDVTISYTGDEEVFYAIEVDGHDVLSGDYPSATWDSISQCYQLDLVIYWGQHLSNYEQYTLRCNVVVTVSAEGYNSISKSQYLEYSLTPGPEFQEPTIGSYLTPDYLAIIVTNWPFSCRELTVNGVYVSSNDNPDYFYYEVEREEEDYTVTVCASYKTMGMSYWLSTSKTLLVPAKLYGDLDGDEMLSVSDVALLIDYLLGYGYDYYNNGDVNKNGEITISDVTMLIDKILQPSI